MERTKAAGARQRELYAPLRVFAGRPVLLGVSGGADSVGLLRALLDVGAHVTAAHLDHGLRDDSARDAAWVRELSGALGVESLVDRVDVARVASAKGGNLEATARTLRYAFLARSAKRVGAGVVLTAHTRDDQAETVLHQLLRGEHVLTGIAAARGRVRRPWLAVRRADIEVYLRELGQDWREDASNHDSRFTRNWLRHHVMPLLRERFPNLDTALARVAEWQTQDEALLAALTAQVPAYAELRREPPAVQRRLVARQLAAAGVSFHAEHVNRLAEAIRAGETRHFTLPGAREVTVTGGSLALARRAWPLPDFPHPAEWVLRHPRAGDRVRLSGGTRKVSDVLGERRVPRAERGEVWLLAAPEGSEVHWVGLNPPVWALGAGESRPAWWDEMGEALTLAREAGEAGEVPVGAVVVCAGKVVAAARNTSREHGDMTRHAELQALRDAAAALGSAYLTDCTLVVTLEPCPMCYGAALEARVGRVVYGAPNEKLGALGGVADVARHPWGHAPQVVPGVRAREAGQLLAQFFRRLRG